MDVAPLSSLTGVGPDDFLAKTWGRKVAHYPGRLAADSGQRITLDRFEEVLATLNRANEGWLHLAAQGLKALPSSLVDADGMLDMERLGAVLGAGHTLYLTKAERIMPSLARLCAGLADELAKSGVLLRSKVNAHVFLTPPQSQGFVPHRDEHGSFILQMDGSKEWTVYEPLTGADRQSSFQPGAVEPEALSRHCPVDVRLEAGDVLYMPEWWPHEARAASAHSLHVTLRIFPLRWVDMVQRLAAGAASLAAAVPAAVVSSPGKLAAELSRKLSDPALLDGLVEPSVGGRAAMWEPGTLREILLRQDVTLDSPLVRAEGMRLEAGDDGDQAALSFSGGVIRGPRALLPVFRFIADTDTFRPRGLPGVALEYDRLEVARRLIGGGLMRIHEAPR